MNWVQLPGGFAPPTGGGRLAGTKRLRKDEAVPYPTRPVPVECVVDARDKLGEGAFWCPVEQAVYWLDIAMPSRLHRLTPGDGRHDTWPMPEMISALAKRRDGTLLVAAQSGLSIFDPKQPGLRRVASPEADQPGNRSNDGAPDAKGRFWIGTMQNNLGPKAEEIPITQRSGALWRIDPDFTATKVEAGLGITNGIAWSPDNRTLYVIDTMDQTIFAYDFDLEAGAIGNKRVFSDVKDLGYADGSCIDAEGHLWNARWEGSAVVRIAPSGKIDRVVPIPATRVTSCAFGGPDLDTLYVTTSRLNLDPETLRRYPQQGGLFALKPGVKGLPRPQFAG
jgi:sugar lactone lactonase YvrE